MFLKNMGFLMLVLLIELIIIGALLFVNTLPENTRRVIWTIIAYSIILGLIILVIWFFRLSDVDKGAIVLIAFLLFIGMESDRSSGGSSFGGNGGTGDSRNLTATDYVRKVNEGSILDDVSLRQSNKEVFESKLKEHFGEDFGRVSDDGKIYQSGFWEGVEIGHMDDKGDVYKKGSWGEEKIGRIDEDGKFREGENA